MRIIVASVLACFSLILTPREFISGAVTQLAFAETKAPSAEGQPETESTPPAERKTRLRIIGSPQGKFRHIITTRLLAITVQVQNAGEVEARGVRVEAISPNGQTHRLRGPRSIGPKDEAQFSGSMNEVISTDKHISARVSCENCY